MKRPIEQSNENLVFENAYVRVYDDAVRFSSGREGTYLRVSMQGEGSGVVVIARHRNQIALVRTFRYPLDSFQWAFPRGFAHGTDVFASATAELEEEVGVHGRDLQLLGHLTPDSGLLSSRVAVLLAEVDEIGREPVDLDEVSEVAWLSSDEITDRMRRGDIEDGFTLGAWTLLRVHLDESELDSTGAD
jgi:8-oxo-dGTP pyrophosphatase MutT (NUDIX family)